MAARKERGEGLTAPELSVLLAYAKIGLADELLATELADDPFLRSDLYSYFPRAMRQDYRRAMEDHPLRREIVVTQIVNDLVNGAGITYLHRLEGETDASGGGADPGELHRPRDLRHRGTAPRDQQLGQPDRRSACRPGCGSRCARWSSAPRGGWSATAARRWTARRPSTTSRWSRSRVLQALPELLTGREKAAFEQRRDALIKQGVPETLATNVAVMPPAYMIIGIVETAARDGVDPLEVARVHFTLGERLGLPTLVARILALPRTDRWETMARAALRDDLHAVHGQLVAQALAGTSSEDTAAARVAAWEERDEERVSRAVETLAGDLRRRCRRPRPALGRSARRALAARVRLIARRLLVSSVLDIRGALRAGPRTTVRDRPPAR